MSRAKKRYSLGDVVVLTLLAQGLLVGGVYLYRGTWDVLTSGASYRNSAEPMNRTMLHVISQIYTSQEAYKNIHGVYGGLGELGLEGYMWREAGEWRTGPYRWELNLLDDGAGFECRVLPSQEMKGRWNSYYVDNSGTKRWSRDGIADGNSPVITDVDAAVYERRPLPVGRTIAGVAILLIVGVAFVLWRTRRFALPRKT